MADRQSVDFAQKFEGLERDPRSELIRKELDALDDRHERNFHETKAGIVVPNTLKGI